jgi:hypothetical protein
MLTPAEVENSVKVLLSNEETSVMVRANALRKLLRYFPTDAQVKTLNDLIETLSHA